MPGGERQVGSVGRWWPVARGRKGNRVLHSPSIVSSPQSLSKAGKVEVSTCPPI